MRFNSEDELFEFIESRKRDTMNTRALLCMSMAIYSAYFQGTHWIRQAMGPDRSGQYGRLLASFNPNDRNMLINDNEITRLTIKAIAATYPSEINVDVQPSPRDMGVVNMSNMQLQEDLLTYSVQACGFPEAARQANHQRGICGTWGVGFRIDVSSTPIEIGGQQVPAKTKHVRAFDFDPTRLMLDPACNKRDLREHDDVVFQDTITKTGIRRMFGIDVKDEDLRPIGTLTINEQNAYAITEGKLFDRYVRDSRTPGAKYYQVHVRGMDGTFRECYVVLELANRKIWINKDNPITPFGGCGMPFGLIYGHRRGETMWGISDTAMLKEGQDKRNTLLTLLFRHIAKHAGYQWIVDKRWFGTGRVVDDEKIKNSLNNMVAGIVIGGGSNDRNVAAPILSQTPPPQGFIADTLMQVGQSMRENTFRSEGNFGGLKSHVPDASYQSALEEAGQVLGIRVNEDIKGTYEPLMAVLLGTQLGHIQSGSPGTLAQLQQDGFDAEDFGELASMDPLYPPCRITVNEASVRYRSPDAKRQQLIQAVQLQAVTPEDFRMSMAGLDSPTSDTDQYMSTEIGKAVSKLLMAGEFEAEPLGQYSKWMIAALQKALFDKRCKANPQLRQMVREAIVQQQQVMMQEMMMSDPAMMAQQQAQPAQAAAQPMSPIDEAIQQFQSQSGVQNVSGQPAMA